MIKNLPAKAGDLRDMGWLPRSGRSPERGHSNPLQYSCLENPIDSGTWRAIVHRVSKSWTPLKQLKQVGTVNEHLNCDKVLDTMYGC